MIHIRENLVGEDEVHILVEGVLDQKSILILSDVCSQHLKTNKRVFLHLDGLLDICRQGVEFLRKSDPRIVIVDAPEFVRLSTCG